MFEYEEIFRARQQVSLSQFLLLSVSLSQFLLLSVSFFYVSLIHSHSSVQCFHLVSFAYGQAGQDHSPPGLCHRGFTAPKILDLGCCTNSHSTPCET
jgi:hypothetical protein